MTARGLVLALAAALAACRTPAPPPLFPLEDDRVQGWIERAKVEARERRGIRAVGRLRVSAPQGGGRTREVIIAERPARLRLESLNFLGQTGTLLVTDGERFSFFDGEGVERGRVSDDLLLDRFGLDLGPAEAVDLLLGDALPGGPPRRVLGSGAERVVEFDSERARFGGDGELRAVQALDASGAVRWEAEFGSWRPVAGGRYPFDLVLYFPLTDLRAELELQEVEVNPDLDGSLFSVPGPAGGREGEAPAGPDERAE